jgi:hypothetical protein
VRVQTRQEAQGIDNRALERGNALLALVHAAQAVVILAPSTDFSLPVTHNPHAPNPNPDFQHPQDLPL